MLDLSCTLAFPGLELVLVESGGDNFASTFSLAYENYWIFVIDVADGDDIPCKRGPDFVSCDLLVMNKIDLAPYFGADLAGMRRDSLSVRKGRSVPLTNWRSGEGVDVVIRSDRARRAVVVRGVCSKSSRFASWGPPIGVR